MNQPRGEMLVGVKADGSLDLRMDEDVSASPDATEWMFRIRSGGEFSNGKTLTAADLVASLRCHTEENSQSGPLGIGQGISDMAAEGDMVKLKLASANADLPCLLSDYHIVIQPDGGIDAPAAGIGAAPCAVEVNAPGMVTG